MGIVPLNIDYRQVVKELKGYIIIFRESEQRRMSPHSSLDVTGMGGLTAFRESEYRPIRNAAHRCAAS